MRSVFFFLILILLVPTSTFAQAQMSSPEYILNLEPIDASSAGSLRTIQPETLLKLRDDGYFITSVNEQPTTLSISSSQIDIDQSETQNIYLSVGAENTYNYQLSAYLWTPLQSSDEDQIPATVCSDKKESCWDYQLSGPDSLNYLDGENRQTLPLQERTPLASREQTIGERPTELKFTVKHPAQENTVYSSLIQILAMPLL